MVLREMRGEGKSRRGTSERGRKVGGEARNSAGTRRKSRGVVGEISRTRVAEGWGRVTEGGFLFLVGWGKEM